MKVLKDRISQRTTDKLHTEGATVEHSENLFDSIHNYLTNPHRFSVKQEEETATESKIRQKKEMLETKLRQMENKYGHSLSMAKGG